TLGYPDAAHERELLRHGDRRDLIPNLEPVLGPEAVIRVQQLVRATHVAEPLLDYAQTLIARTRERSDLKLGLSPRAGQGLIRAAQAWARLAGRSAVMPEDVQAVLPAVVAHRLEGREAGHLDSSGSPAGRDVAQELISTVPVPT
ncbi:MAG: AAA family ATPase, partial [Steroidobacteraceae bacterium]